MPSSALPSYLRYLQYRGVFFHFYLCPNIPNISQDLGRAANWEYIPHTSLLENPIKPGQSEAEILFRSLNQLPLLLCLATSNLPVAFKRSMYKDFFLKNCFCIGNKAGTQFPLMDLISNLEIKWEKRPFEAPWHWRLKMDFLSLFILPFFKKK